jgi:glucokinase
MPKDRLYVGVDLGGTNMQIGVVDAGNTIVGECRRKTQADAGLEKVLDRIVGGIERACEAAGIGVKDLAGVGIGAPSPIDPQRGVVTRAVNLGWRDVHLADILSQRLGVPVTVDNDVNVAVYGEWRLGAGQGTNDLLGVWVGTGVGGGLILRGELYSGQLFTGGEIGQIRLFPGAPRGSSMVEDFCSRTAVAARLARRIMTGEPSMLKELTGGKLDSIKSKLIARAYNEGDPLTREVVHEAADLLAVPIANAVTLLGLPRVVLGGGLSEALGEAWTTRVRDAVRREVFFDSTRAVEVVASTLEDNAGLLGAALLARGRLG